MAGLYGPRNPEATYIPHYFTEQVFATGEVRMNYATVGLESTPALLLIPVNRSRGGAMKPRCILSGPEADVTGVRNEPNAAPGPLEDVQDNAQPA